MANESNDPMGDAEYIAMIIDKHMSAGLMTNEAWEAAEEIVKAMKEQRGN